MSDSAGFVDFAASVTVAFEGPIYESSAGQSVSRSVGQPRAPGTGRIRRCRVERQDSRLPARPGKAKYWKGESLGLPSTGPIAPPRVSGRPDKRGGRGSSVSSTSRVPKTQMGNHPPDPCRAHCILGRGSCRPRRHCRRCPTGGQCRGRRAIAVVVTGLAPRRFTSPVFSRKAVAGIHFRGHPIGGSAKEVTIVYAQSAALAHRML